jgi:anti-sigma regulatory factor (Ser/Thr protein kinase)
MARFTAVRYATATLPHRHVASYSGRVDQLSRMRRELRALLDGSPAADDVILCASELAANAVQHSRSGRPGGTFTIRVEISRGDHVRIAVDDDGGAWIEAGSGYDRGRGLWIVTALARDWGIVTGPAGRTVWALLDWAAGV